MGLRYNLKRKRLHSSLFFVFLRGFLWWRKEKLSFTCPLRQTTCILESSFIRSVSTVDSHIYRLQDEVACVQAPLPFQTKIVRLPGFLFALLSGKAGAKGEAHFKGRYLTLLFPSYDLTMNFHDGCIVSFANYTGATHSNFQTVSLFNKVGRTIPGTLSLKFTRYRSNWVLIQTPATVPEEEFQVAFTKEFLNKGLMDNLLMTTLLTSKENSSGVYSTHKVEVNSIMSDYIGRCPSCIPLVKGTLLNHTSRRASRNNSNPVYPPNMPAVQGDKTVQLALKALVSNKVPDLFVTYCLQRALKYCQEFTALLFTTKVTGTEYVPIVGPLSRQ